MSAIAGMIDWRGGPAGPAVRKAIAALALHGRDGENVWDGGDVALGWRKTVMHQEDYADHQPLTGGGGRFKLVFDGRIDNREDLARDFALDPERARDMPDSAYVLAAFEKWGEDCPKHLLGDFAFAVWDSEKRALFLVRDPLGCRPLYYHSGQGFLMFATMPSGLFCNTSVPRDIDDEAIYLNLAAITLEQSRTFFRDVARVPTGHGLFAAEGSMRTVRHWRPEEIEPLRYKRDEDYVEAFREILRESVRCRLRTIHPIGSHLSSGWDSSTVTATAAKLLAEQGKSLTSFTSVPPKSWTPRTPSNGTPDEGPIANLVANRFSNIDHVLIPSSGRWDLDEIDREADVSELPRKVIFNTGWINSLNTDARARGIRVMLSGGKGNSTISWDGSFLLAQLCKEGKLAELATEWMALHRTMGMSHRHLAATTFGQYFPIWAWSSLSRLRDRRDALTLMQLGLNQRKISRRRLREMALASPTLSLLTFHRMDHRSIALHISRFPDMAHLWAGTIGAYNIEMRDPTADRRMLALRVATPERQYLHRGQTKWLLRRAMDGILPPELINQRQRGQQAANWFDAASSSLDVLKEELNVQASTPRVAAIIDVPLFQRLIKEWPQILPYTDTDQVKAYRRFAIILNYGRFVRRFLNTRRDLG